MLSICAYAKAGDEILPMTDEMRADIKEMTRHLNEDGLRVLVVAIKQSSANPPRL